MVNQPDIRVARIETPEERDAWDSIAAKSSVGHLHQCSWWAEPLSRYNVRSETLGCWRDGQLVGGALFRSIPVPLTRYSIAVCLDGPLFLTSDPGCSDAFVAALVELARDWNSLSVTITGCPSSESHAHIIASMTRAGLQTTEAPGDTYAVLKLNSATIDDIWGGFNKGTRYSIKKAGKGSVSVRNVTSTEGLKQAHDAWMATAARKDFTDVRPWVALEPVLKESAARGVGAVLASFRHDRMLAAAFITYVGETAEYVYGGYFDGAQKHCPNHVLHYEAIQHSLERGLKAYSFGTLQQPDRPGEAGVDFFKLGFGSGPQQTLPTIVWERRPRLHRQIRWLQRQRFGRAIEGILKRLLTR